MDKKTCNPSIRCDVSSCAHHTAENCCCLSQIQVGCCGCTPTKADGTGPGAELFAVIFTKRAGVWYNILKNCGRGDRYGTDGAHAAQQDRV